MEQTNQVTTSLWPESVGQKIGPAELLSSRGSIHACRIAQRGLQQAHDRLMRANRDLGETAGFVTASLTTVTAVEAVINIAVDKIGLSKQILHMTLDGYIGLFILIFIWGFLRAENALRSRAQAERDMDQAKRAIFEFCPAHQWPKLEE